MILDVQEPSFDIFHWINGKLLDKWMHVSFVFSCRRIRGCSYHEVIIFGGHHALPSLVIFCHFLATLPPLNWCCWCRWSWSGCACTEVRPQIMSRNVQSSCRHLSSFGLSPTLPPRPSDDVIYELPLNIGLTDLWTEINIGRFDFFV